ncbi:MAG: hypothetical protein H0W61_04490 [Bacteroidetes bacterium]|nr:hypothetical protein [Bacteroidota bacterium]
MKTLIKFAILLLICALPLINHAQTKNSISIASKPFSTRPATQKEFKAGSTIYCRINVEKTLKQYARELDAAGLQNVREDGLEGKYTHFITIEIKDQNSGKEDHVPSEINIYLSESDLSKNQLDLDIISDEDHTSTYFYGPRATFFNQFTSLRDEDNYIGQLVNFQLVLNEYKIDDKYRYDKGLIAVKVEGNTTPGYTKDTYTNVTSKDAPSGFITIDYTQSTKETQKNWYNEQAAILDATLRQQKSNYAAF